MSIINGAYFYKQGSIRVSRKSIPGAIFPSSSRGVVRKMSSKSRQRLALVAMETARLYKSMLTLTYPTEIRVSGSETKKHLSCILRKLGRYAPFFKVLWFMEFTKKGQVHYHILSNIEATNINRSLIALEWSDIITRDQEVADRVFYVHSRKEAMQSIRTTNGAARYALKYALKTDCKKFPDWFNGSGRFWGANRAVLEEMGKPEFIKMDEEGLRRVMAAYGVSLDNIPLIIFRRMKDEEGNVSRETIS